MNDYTEIIKIYFAAQQRTNSLPCPRCGKRHVDLTNREMSINEHIHICKSCSMDEIWREYLHQDPKDINRWALMAGFAVRVHENGEPYDDK